jgi:hypothetical protein
LSRKDRWAIAFPICYSREEFNASLKTVGKRRAKLPGVPLADTAIIRRAQPYLHGKRKRPYHSLAILSALNNTDKHEALQPVIFLPDRGGYEITDSRDCVLRDPPRRARRNVLKIGAELARLPAKRTGPDPYIQVETIFAAFPALHETLGLEEWLWKTQRFILELLAMFSDPPNDKLGELGLPPIVRAPRH